MKIYEKYLNEEKDASVMYKKNYNSVMINLDKLKKVLWTHSRKQFKNPTNWGYTGDLEHLNNELEEIVKNFK